MIFAFTLLKVSVTDTELDPFLHTASRNGHRGSLERILSYPCMCGVMESSLGGDEVHQTHEETQKGKICFSRGKHTKNAELTYNAMGMCVCKGPRVGIFRSICVHVCVRVHLYP